MRNYGNKNGERLFYMMLLLVIGLFSLLGRENYAYALSGKVTNACNLLTRADAEQIVGGPVNNPVTRNAKGGEGKSFMSMCSYAKTGGGLEDTVSLMFQGGTVVQDSDKALELYKSQTKSIFGDGFAMVEIKNLADGALWQPVLHKLIIIKGSDKITVTVPKGDAATTRKQAVALGNKLLGRIN